ncbi:MAG: hypothetical protein HQL14_05635 [Candidatus Omnitrophica bacterium]|nr:hypothetical protein [Candidatus Omnitrophota bacterium]
MFYCIFALFLIFSGPASAQNLVSPQSASLAQNTLIQSISIEGFLLQDKNRFFKLFKPYRNKNLSKVEMDAILQKVQDIYDQEGYQQLVSITYSVKKHRLVFMVSLTS